MDVPRNVNVHLYKVLVLMFVASLLGEAYGLHIMEFQKDSGKFSWQPWGEVPIRMYSLTIQHGKLLGSLAGGEKTKLWIMDEHGPFSLMFNPTPSLQEDFFAFCKKLKAAGLQPARSRSNHDCSEHRGGGAADGCSKKPRFHQVQYVESWSQSWRPVDGASCWETHKSTKGL